MEREPQLLSTKHFEYCCDESVENIHDYFKKQKVFAWCLQDYVEYTIANEPKLDFFQALNMFTSSLKTLNQNCSTPLSVKSLCSDYLKWLTSDAGLAITTVCFNVFSTKKLHKQAITFHNTVE
ncbi:27177_t:CDS:2, partial [Racocetra persica]